MPPPSSLRRRAILLIVVPIIVALYYLLIGFHVAFLLIGLDSGGPDLGTNFYDAHSELLRREDAGQNLFTKESGRRILFQSYPYDIRKVPQKVFDNIRKFAPEYEHRVYNDSLILDFFSHSDLTQLDAVGGRELPPGRAPLLPPRPSLERGRSSAAEAVAENEPPENVDTAAENEDAPISQRLVPFFNRLTYGPFKADLFRYAALYLEGGLWLDIDVQPLASVAELFPDRDRVVYEWGKSAAVLSAPRGHPLMLELLHRMLATPLEKLNDCVGCMGGEDRSHLVVDQFRRLLEERGVPLQEGAHKYWSDEGFAPMSDGGTSAGAAAAGGLFSWGGYGTGESAVETSVKNGGMLDLYLLDERCEHEGPTRDALCPDGLDHYGYCCGVWNQEERVFRSRYRDYPWLGMPQWLKNLIAEEQQRLANGGDPRSAASPILGPLLSAARRGEKNEKNDRRGEG